MGHDIVITNCPRPVADDCICGYECSHTEYDSSYISFNFAGYENYWHIRNAHGFLTVQLKEFVRRF
jgi:hypothetical protein